MADQFDPSTATPVDDFDPSTAQPYTPAGPLRRLADTGLALAKGVVGVPESVVGVADLATKGKAGKLAEQAGVRFKDAKDVLTSFQSEDQQAADREVQQADGFLPTLGAMVQNPSTIVNAAAESAPSMVTGGVAARGMMRFMPKAGPITAGAVGEGVVAAGQNAEQVRQETPTGLLTGDQSAVLAGSGAATGAISRLSGGLANKLGIGDVQTMIAAGKLGTVGEKAGATAAKKGALRKVAEGALVEGGLQELPQSAQEQAAQNIALGKPWDEGVGAAAAQGLLVGGVTGAVGGGMGALSGEPGAPPPAPAVAPPSVAPAGPGVAPPAAGAPSAGPGPFPTLDPIDPNASATPPGSGMSIPGLPTIDPNMGPISRAASILAGPGGVISAPVPQLEGKSPPGASTEKPANATAGAAQQTTPPAAPTTAAGLPASSAQVPGAAPSSSSQPSQPPVATNPTAVPRETPRPQGPIAAAAAKAAAPAPVPAPASPAPANQPAADGAAAPALAAQPGPGALTPTPTTPQEPASEKAPEAVQGQARREEPGQAAPAVSASGSAVQPAASPAVGPEVQGNAPPAGQKVVQAIDPDTGEIAFEQSAPEAPATIDAPANFAATSPLNDNPEPTEAQKKAGNYRKGHVRLAGMDMAIENPAGSTRKGVDKSGKAWENELQHHYGYIKGTIGNDKDHVDAFVKPETPLDYDGPVFVIDQVDPDTGKFDEHKVVIGAKNGLEARQIYRANYAKGWKGDKAVTEMPMAEFKAWVYDGPKNKPLASSAPVPEATAAVKSNTEAKLLPAQASADQKTPLPRKGSRKRKEMDRAQAKADQERARAESAAIPESPEDLAKDAYLQSLSVDQLNALAIKAGIAPHPKRFMTETRLDRIPLTQLQRWGGPADTTNPVNNKTRPADLESDQSLLLMPCSEGKLTEASRAGDMYRGVMWQTLRTHSTDESRPRTVILSAKHGFISPDEKIDPYEQRMTPESADEMLADVDALAGKIADQLGDGPIRDVMIVGGAEYRRVMRAAVSRLIQQSHIQQDASVNETGGAIGEQRQQLGQYLDIFKVTEVKEKKGGNLAAARAAAYEANPLKSFLAKHGLYHVKGEPRSQKVEFSPDGNPMVPGYGPVFRRNGLFPDQLAELAIQDGFLPEGATGDDMEQLIMRVMRGERIAPMYAEGEAESDFQRRYSARLEELEDQHLSGELEDPFDPLADLDYEEVDAERAGYYDAPVEVKLEVDALLAQADEAGIDTETIKDEAHYANPEGSSADYYQVLRTALQEALSAGRGDRSQNDGGQAGADGPSGSQDEGLTAPTRADVLDQQIRAEQAQELDDRAQIQREADGFQLQTQSVERRQDNTGDMFGGPSAGDYQAAKARKATSAPSADDLFGSDPRNDPDAGFMVNEPKKAYGVTRKAIEQAITRVATYDAAQTKALVGWIAKRPDAARIVANLNEHAGTPWAKQSLQGALTRAALEEYAAGRTPAFDSLLNAPTAVGLRTLLERNGADGAWLYLSREGVVGNSSKPVNSVSSSFIDCNPSKDCAQFCYAAKGNFAFGTSVRKSELMTWAAETDPKRLGQLMASEYASTLEFQHQKALRLFDKGDGTDAWLPVIAELNAWKGPDGKPAPIRVQVFSKNPEFLRQVPEMNLRMLSVDKSNLEVARANADLPIAFVYTDASQIAFLSEVKDRVAVILPVKQGVKLLDQAKIDELPQWTKPVVCPVDAGRVVIGKNHFNKTDTGSTLITQQGEWNCTRCDKGGGVGCFHKSTTDKALAAYGQPVHTRADEDIDRITAELRAVSGRLPPGERAELLGSLDRLLSAVRAGVDIGTEGTGRAGDAARTGADDGWQPVRITGRRNPGKGGGGPGGQRVESPRRKYDNGQLDFFLSSQPDPSQAGPAVEGARRSAVAAVDDLHATGTVLGRALSSDYAARQRVSLVGQTVAGVEDLAVLVQVYRDPRFETLRVFFTDTKGAIVSQMGLTSRLPGSAAGIVGNDIDEYMRELAGAAKKTGATSFYMLHNHPSGIPTPSDADRNLTATYAARMPGLNFEGHIVIDTNEYAVIDGRGNSKLHRKDFGQVPPPGHAQWTTPLSGPPDVMRIAKGLQVDRNAVTLVVVDHQFKVRGITTIPADSVSDNKLSTSIAVRRATLREKGAFLFAVARDHAKLRQVGHLVIDAIAMENDGSVKSLVSIGALPVSSSGPFPRSRRVRVSSDSSPAFAYLREQTLQAAEPGRQRVKESEARKKGFGVDPETRTANFGRWSNDAPLITSAEAGAYSFKTSEKVVLEAFHGTKRPDRVGNVFQRKRATSGPMAFFTSAPDLASSYAQGKQDTSLAQEDQQYANWFKYKPAGSRSTVGIDRAWYFLPQDVKAKIAERMPDIRTDDDMNVIYEQGGGDIGSYEWELKKTQRGIDRLGNPLQAAVETWLTSGALFGREEGFMDVLRLAGFPMSEVEFDSPHAEFPFVYKTFIKMQNPLVTSDVPRSVKDALQAAAKRDRSRADQGIASDMWDKNNRTLRDWVSNYLDDKNNSAAYVWTSIPDKVTDVFKSLGYDGIIDWSGKGGGHQHPVYIPFEETQVKSALGNKGTYDDSKKDIRFARGKTDQRGVHMDDAKAVVAAIREALPTAPPIHILESVAKAPKELQRDIRAAGAENDVDAAYHNGEIYVFPANVPSIERLQFVLAHHEIRHHGLRAILGPRMNQVLFQIQATNPAVRAAAQRQVEMGYAKSRVLATEEAIADMAVEDIVKLNGWDKIVAAVRQWLRGVAMRLRRAGLAKAADAMEPSAWTDKDVAGLIARAEGVSRGGSAKYPSEGTVFGQDGAMPAFYSALSREIGASAARAQPAQGWISSINGMVKAGKIKREELEWSGVLDWLQMQAEGADGAEKVARAEGPDSPFTALWKSANPSKVTREQLVAYLDANGVKVTERVLTEADNRMMEPDEIRSDMLNEYQGRDTGWLRAHYEATLDAAPPDGHSRSDLIADIVDARMEYFEGNPGDYSPAQTRDGAAKYGQYQLPGGTNYREVLLTLPTGGPSQVEALSDAELRALILRNDGNADVDDVARADLLAMVGNMDMTSTDIAKLTGKNTAQYKSGHWDQPNVLAHIRVNDRVDVDGKRVLFVEEIQSDWGQEGKKKGFVSGVAATAKNLSAVPDGDTGAWYVYPKSRTEDAAPYIGIRTFANSGAAAIAETSAHPWNRIISGDKGDVLTGSEAGKTPSAPFVTNTDKWLTLALKRIVKMAVDEGYDRVAFVNGDQSAARYDLSKQVDSLEWLTRPTGAKMVSIAIGSQPVQLIVSEDGKVVAAKGRGLEQADGKMLDEVLGKDAASQIMAGDKGQLSDLKVGGEGMKAFYDKIVPNTLKDVLRKVGGGAMETVDISPSGERLKPQPGFDITPAMREKVAGGLPLFARGPQAPAASRFARTADPASAATLSGITDTIKTAMSPLGTVNLWDKTVGTQYNKATKDRDFKRVFDGYVQQTDDTAHFAIEAEAKAPDILLRLESAGDIWRGLLQGLDPRKAREHKANLEAVARPLFASIEGQTGIKQVRYDDDSLRIAFNLTPKQIEMYHQARAAVDTSIARLAQTYAAQMGVDHGMEARDLKDFDLADTVAMVKTHIQDVHDEERAAYENARQMLSEITPEDEAADETAAEMAKHARTIPEGPSEEDTAAQMEKLDLIQKHAEFLQETGYMPALRFGEYAVTVTDTDGEVLHFEMFESKIAANLAARQLGKEYPGKQVDTGVMNPDQYALFKGVSPETVALFAKFNGQDQSQAYKDYIALAKSARSVKMRELQRKGIAGFSEDPTRVLAAFLTSNARQSAINMNIGDITNALASKSLARKGDVQREAQKLHEYMSNPLEEARGLRGFMFAHFMGGSIASALVNLTQPVIQTAPYLHQWAGAKTAGIMARSAKMAASGKIEDRELHDAAARAAQDGITEPHEIHALMADASSSGFGNSLKARALVKAWGSLFALTEAFNRRVTFLAAYQTATETGQADPYAFARKAVIETQGLYSKANRPNWARGALGATIFTFKQFSIAYWEFLLRLPRKQKVLALTILVIAAGLQGLPFADDIEDLIDTIGQSLGYNTNAKKALRKMLVDNLGKDLGTILDVGLLSALTPVDVQGRLSMGNLIPATAAFKPSETDKARTVSELAGPLGGILASAQKALGAFQRGDGAAGAREMLPVAIKNVAQGVSMASSGVYKDSRGYKVASVTGFESFVKMLGLQPASIAAKTRVLSDELQSKSMTTMMESMIADRWAQGVVERDLKAVAQARQTLAAWNLANPESRIVIQPTQIQTRVKKMLQDRDERFIKTVPREQRNQVRQELLQ